MIFEFISETSASSRVEGLNMALVGNIFNIKLKPLFLELQKRIASQERTAAKDVMLHSQRLSCKIQLPYFSIISQRVVGSADDVGSLQILISYGVCAELHLRRS